MKNEVIVPASSNVHAQCDSLPVQRCFSLKTKRKLRVAVQFRENLAGEFLTSSGGLVEAQHPPPPAVPEHKLQKTLILFTVSGARHLA